MMAWLRATGAGTRIILACLVGLITSLTAYATYDKILGWYPASTQFVRDAVSVALYPVAQGLSDLRIDGLQARASATKNTIEDLEIKKVKTADKVEQRRIELNIADRNKELVDLNQQISDIKKERDRR